MSTIQLSDIGMILLAIGLIVTFSSTIFMFVNAYFKTQKYVDKYDLRNKYSRKNKILLVGSGVILMLIGFSSTWIFHIYEQFTVVFGAMFMGGLILVLNGLNIMQKGLRYLIEYEHRKKYDPDWRK